MLARAVPAWANHPAFSKKFDRNMDEIPRYARIEQSMAREAQKVISALERGDLDKKGAMAAMRDSLREHETAAFVAGRRARKDLRDYLTEGEEAMLAGRFSRNMKYFSGFCDDVLEGRGRMPYAQRAEAYAKSLWSIYTRGESAEWADEDQRFFRYVWVLDVEAEHCKDCLLRAAESRNKGGFTWDELSALGWPGENTRCLYNCRCHIRRVRIPIDDERYRQSIPSEPKEIPRETARAGYERFLEQIGEPDRPNRLPAAGVPFVIGTREAIARSVADQPSPGLQEALLMFLPLVPDILKAPKIVLESGSMRIYSDALLVIAIQRGLDGLWRTYKVSLAPEFVQAVAN